jgi:hypothetical protein
MDEQEFDALFQRPFGREDLERAEAGLGRCGTLAVALFGRTPEDLRRQLVASHPEIPSGFALADFRDLERHLPTISGLVLSGSSNPRLKWLSPWLTQSASASITVDGQRYTVWEARCEIVRRAIEYLKRR